MKRASSVLLAVALLVGLGLASLPEAEARPGGGSTYRGSSSSRSSSSGSRSYSSSSSRSSYSSGSRSYSSSGSSSSGGGGGVFLMLMLVGVAVLVFIVRNHAGGNNWATTVPPTAPLPRRPQTSLRTRLSGLARVGPRGADGKVRPHDPDFSLILFEDFTSALFSKVHEARGGGRLDTLSAYLGDDALASLQQLGRPQKVQAVVVGAMTYTDVHGVAADSPRVSVTLRFEANYTEVSSTEQGWYVAEEWTLERDTSVRSRPPEEARVFRCPNCGAPLDAVQGHTCSYCGKVVSTGEFDWVVTRVTSLERERRGPQLTGTTEEQGTDLPTLKDSRAQELLNALTREDPGVTGVGLRNRLEFIFQEMQAAWSQREWKGMRPFLSDNLFQTQLFWINAYREAGLRNVTQNAHVTKLVLARVTQDAYYDAVTLRVYARSLDYTVRDDDGRVVGGSRSRERAYSEYWTLIRGRGVKGRPGTDKRCPSCGAPLSINMAGHCTHCQARVVSGDFDWVLSRIEQDEAYQG